MHKIESIPTTLTPYASSLTRDYLDGKEIGVTHDPVIDYSGIEKLAHSRSMSPEKRKILASRLHEQYEADGIDLDKSSMVYANIESLTNPKVFTFTTGQQLHIFLGPLFFIYKIKSLLRHVQNFNALNHGLKAVPIFWMASEDHDFEEINYVKLYGEVYRWEAKAGNAVGRMTCEGLLDVLNKLEERADKTEENSKFYGLFRKHYQPGTTLSAATRGLLHALFGDKGLLILNPDDKILKSEFKELAVSELVNRTLNTHYNLEKNKLKLAGYKPKVNALEINYFWFDNEQRAKLKTSERGFVETESGEILSLEHIENHIENLSPNVLARPLYQECILPNLLYLGGNAEIEYWLPIKSSFEALGLSFPALWLRDSVIYLSEKNVKLLQENNLSPGHLFQSESELATHYFNQENETETEMDSKLMRLAESLDAFGSDDFIKKLNSGKVFKEINEMKKAVKRLESIIEDEKIEFKKQDPNFKRLLKLKEQNFDSKPEREFYFISNYSALNWNTTEESSFISTCQILKM